MSGETESKGGQEERKSAVLAEWGGEPVNAEDSVVLGAKNDMGYPPVLFIDDIPSFLAEKSVAWDVVTAQYTQMEKKYRVLERSVIPKLAELKAKVPEFDNTLKMLDFLRAKQEGEESFTTHFNLMENVYAKADVNPNNKVFLWMGANTMVEYTYDEATELLTKNRKDSLAEIEDLENRLKFIRAQIHTAAVSTSRLFNWDVVRRKKEREAAAAKK